MKAFSVEDKRLADRMRPLAQFNVETHIGSYVIEEEIDNVMTARLAMALIDACEQASKTGVFPKSVRRIDPWTAAPFKINKKQYTLSSRGTGVRAVPKNFLRGMQSSLDSQP